MKALFGSKRQGGTSWIAVRDYDSLRVVGGTEEDVVEVEFGYGCCGSGERVELECGISYGIVSGATRLKVRHTRASGIPVSVELYHGADDPSRLPIGSAGQAGE